MYMGANTAKISKSYTLAQQAAEPFTEIMPEPRSPLMAYVMKSSPLLMFQMWTCSFSQRLAAVIRELRLRQKNVVRQQLQTV
jgi:hypothetical protein